MRDAVPPPQNPSAVVAAMLTPRRLARPSPPDWGEASRLATPLGELAVWSAGTGAGVLLVHGWEGAHDDLDAFVAPLLRAGRRVVAFDLPAHGASAGTTASLYDAAVAVAHVATAAAPLAAVVAHSMGAPASALAFERGVHVERAVFLSAPRAYSNYVSWVAGRSGIAVEVLLEALARRGIDVAGLDFERTAAAANVPALFVHSRDDRTTSIAEARVVAAAWRGSTFDEVEGLGHTRILRDPAVVASVVAFVSGGANSPLP